MSGSDVREPDVLQCADDAEHVLVVLPDDRERRARRPPRRSAAGSAAGVELEHLLAGARVEDR